MFITNPTTISVDITPEFMYNLLHERVGLDAYAVNTQQVMYMAKDPEHIKDPAGFHPKS